MSKKESKDNLRVLKIDISKENKCYQYFDELCLKSKNLYNTILYYSKNYYYATKSLAKGQEIHQNSIDIMNEIDSFIEEYNSNTYNHNLECLENNKEFIDKLKSVEDSAEFQKEIKEYNKKVVTINKTRKKDKLKRLVSYLSINNSDYGVILNSNLLDKFLKQTESYSSMAGDTSNTLVNSMDDVWKGYNKSLIDYFKNPSKYKGMPKPPNYKDRGDVGRSRFQCRRCYSLKDERVEKGQVYSTFILDKSDFKGKNFEFKVPFGENTKINQVRLIPKGIKITMELVYEIDVNNKSEFNNRCAAIDIGINRLATVVNNVGIKAFAINGNPLKSYNIHWNKQMAKIKSELMKVNGKYSSNKTQKITNDRNNYMTSYMHKSSRYIINWCIENNIDNLIIGKNKGWKNNVELGNTTQTFVQIPFARFIEMLQYKGQQEGIKVIVREESYTSKASFIDNDTIGIYGKNDNVVYSGYRKTRGLYISKNDIEINADINGAYNILRKEINEFTYNNDYLHPVIINVA